MPRDKAHEVKVGVFVAAGLGIFLLFLIALTGLGLTGGEDEYRVRFTNVAGLENGSIVALGGLKVGRVESVGISPKDKSMMEAVIRVKKGTPIRKDSEVEVTSVGITGSMYLSISLGTADSPLLKPGAVIRGTEAASFQEVINEAKGAAERVNAILSNVGDTVDTISADARAAMRDIRVKVSRALDSADRVFRRAEEVMSEKNVRNVNRFLASISRVADRLDKNIEPTVKEFRLTMQRIRASLDEVDRTARSFTALAGDAAGFVGDLRKRIVKVDRILDRMDRIGGGLEKVVAHGDEAVGKLTLVLEEEIRGVRKDVRKEIETTGETLRGQIVGVGGQAKATIQEGGQSLNKTLAAVEAVSNQLEEFFVSNRAELRAVIVNFSSVSKRIDKILEELSGGSGGAEIRSAAEELRLAIQRARSLMSQLDDTVATHREDIHLLITDLRETASNLNEFTTTLRERPATALFRPPARPREFTE